MDIGSATNTTTLGPNVSQTESFCMANASGGLASNSKVCTYPFSAESDQTIPMSKAYTRTIGPPSCRYGIGHDTTTPWANPSFIIFRWRPSLKSQDLHQYTQVPADSTDRQLVDNSFESKCSDTSAFPDDSTKPKWPDTL